MTIQELKNYANQKYFTSLDFESKAHHGYAVHQIEQFKKHQEKYNQVSKAMPPHGAPHRNGINYMIIK